jgi:hypothetical protein
MISKLWNSFRRYWAIYIIITVLFILNTVTRSLNIFAYDVFGYYLYLPKLFADGNLHFENLDWVNKIVEKYHNTPTLYQFSWIDNQNWVIRYSSGMAILYLPFYLVAHIVAVVFNYPADGFSAPYQWSIFLESMLVTILGFVLLQKVLRAYFENQTVQITLAVIFFGTNMIVHSGMFGLNVMSHNYLFMMYAMLMYLSERYVSSNSIKFWYLAILCCGLMALVRPVEIFSLLIPLLWRNINVYNRADSLSLSLSLCKNKLKEFNFKKQKLIVLSILILIGLGSIQFLYWKIETGYFFINSYANPGEGLDLISPHILDYLFSFRKGWLLYTPLVGLCIIGFWSLYKFQRNVFYALILVFLCGLYLAASWSVWWYSASFSSRAALPMYAYLSFPLAAMVHSIFIDSKINSVFKYGVGLVIAFFIFLNLFQSYQYYLGIIDSERMTKAAYCKNFLSLKRHPDTEWLLLKSRSETGYEKLDSTTPYQRRIIGYEDMEFGKDPNFVFDPVYEGRRSQRIKPLGYSKDLRVPFNATTTYDYAYLKVSAYVYIPASADSIVKVSLCAQMEHKEKTYFWRALNFESLNLLRDQWQYVEFVYLTPEVRSREDLFKTFIWNRGNIEIYVDKMMLETFY